MEGFQLSKIYGDLIISTTNGDDADGDCSLSSEFPSSLSSTTTATALLEEHFHSTIKHTMDTFHKRETLLEAIKFYNVLPSFGYVWEFKDLSREFIHDREVVIEGLKKTIYNYSELNDALKRDKGVILASVIGDPLNGFESVPDEFKSDRELFCKVLKISAFSLRFASEELRNDRELVLKAINTSPLALRFASEQLRRDLELVVKAVKQRSRILEYLDADIIQLIVNDRECLENIIRENPYAVIDFVNAVGCRHLKNDKILFLIAFQKGKDRGYYHYMGNELKQDKEFITQVLQIVPQIFNYLSDDLKMDPQIANLVVNNQ